MGKGQKKGEMKEEGRSIVEKPAEEHTGGQSDVQQDEESASIDRMSSPKNNKIAGFDGDR